MTLKSIRRIEITASVVTIVDMLNENERCLKVRNLAEKCEMTIEIGFQLNLMSVVLDLLS